MLAKAGAYLRQHHLGLLALFIALSGTAYAATLPQGSVGTRQLKDGAVTSDKVKDRSLLDADFKKGELPKGAKGDRGPRGKAGPKGDRGKRGKPGKRGKQGRRGAPGATNVAVRTAPLSAGVGPETGATAACSGGERATGGGYRVESGSVTAVESRPDPADGVPAGWHVAVTATAPAQVTVYAVCASP
jgi:hypothetical protein